MAHSVARVLLLLMLGACGVIEVAPAAAPTAKREARNSLLLITIDTLRADALGSYGGAHETPALDALAASGTRFSRVYSPAPLTMPAHSSLMTGLYPPRHGVRNNGAYVLPAGFDTLAEQLAGAGYATGAFVSAAVLEARFGLAQGFASYDHETGEERGALYAERSATATTARALAWLDAHTSSTEPFFLWVHYFDPHAPYEPPAPWADEFASDPYAGEVAAVDAAVDRLLAALSERRLEQSTLVAVVSDHGESLGEHGEKTHALSLYDATQHVPLILAGPGIPKGEVVDTLASLVDVAPTLLSSLGAAPLPQAQGFDLLASHPPRETVYAETLATQLDFGWSPLFATRSRTHLYVQAPRPELYADAAQLQNLLEDPSKEDSDRAASLRAAVALQQVAQPPAKGQPLDAETRERLRSLGYVIPDRAHEASGVDPKDGVRAVSAYIRAQEALERGEIETACREGEVSVRLLPSSARPRVAYMRALLARGDPQAALEHAEAAVRLSPRWADTHYWLAEIARQLGDEALASRAFAEALRLDPSHPAAKAAQEGGPRG